MSIDAGPADREFKPPPSTILVVDDNPVNLQVIVRTLDGAGHRLLAARDGRAAIEIARRARPELILLDVMMPGQNGFDVCRALKAEPATRDAMIIFLSALGEVDNKVHGLELGAVDYITKPIQAEEVVARVTTHLTRQFLERELRRNRDRLNRELEGAARMQRLLLPATLPTHERLRCAAYYRTSRHAGGDYYDVLSLRPGRIGVMVADVSGHGAPAAIVMAMLRATLHASQEREHPPSVFHFLNQQFSYLWETSMFATGIYAVVDVPGEYVSVSCAGHPAPLLYRRRRGVVPLAIEAVPPLLMMEFGVIPCVTTRLEPGDRLLFFTDGIPDRLADNGSMYDLDRLSQAFSLVGHLPPQAIVDAIVSDVAAFAGAQEPDDDQTLLVVGLE